MGVLAAALLVAVGVTLGLFFSSDRNGDGQDVVIGEINSADRIIFWTGCDDVAELTDAELDQWKGRGVDGFVCMTGQLKNLGGSNDFTGVAGAGLAGGRYGLQRRLRDADLADRAQQRKMKLYLGFYASNTFNRVTPFVDWFEDQSWSRKVLPSVRQLAAAARRLGFAGLAIDQELYTDPNASWDWNYAGGDHSESQVRAKVKQRGVELMTAMVRGFPGLQLMAYDTKVPGSWQDLVQERINNLSDVYRNNVQIDLWDGLSSVRGYRAIRWMDAVFYKAPHLQEATWDTALQYNANAVYSLLSRRFSNWAYASSRLHLSPFSWISEGPSEFERARDPDEVDEQLAAFRRWGSGGEFANYAYNGLDEFDYTPYVPALRSASTPGQVDAAPPRLSITRRTRKTNSRRLTLGGVATDNFAIRAVRWRDDAGHSGVMQLSWVVDPGTTGSVVNSRMLWTSGNIPLRKGATTISVIAEDIKGLTTVRTVRVRR